MERNLRRVCRSLVGLGDVEVLGVDDLTGEPLRAHVRCRAQRPACGSCGARVWSHGSRRVELAGLPACGRAMRLVWHKRRWRCSSPGCEAGVFTEQDPSIAPARAALTARAARWATRRAGRGDRSTRHHTTR